MPSGYFFPSNFAFSLPIILFIFVLDWKKLTSVHHSVSARNRSNQNIASFIAQAVEELLKRRCSSSWYILEAKLFFLKV